MKKTWRYRGAVAVLTLPALLTFTGLIGYPVFQSLIKSFYNWNGATAGKRVGLGNYVKLFRADTFYLSNKNSLIFALVLVVYQIFFGLLMALLLVSIKTRFSGFFRFTYFLPVVISSTVICQMWVSLFNYDYGLFNQIFEALGIHYRQAWLTGKNSAIFAVAFVNAWQFMGIEFIMFYTAVSGISQDLYEAARIDGASTVQMHRRITIPLLRETFRFCLILAFTGGLKAFDTMYIMTGGGPGDYTTSLTYMMYKSAFTGNKFGYGSAIATVIVLECLACTVLLNKLFRIREE